MNKFYINIGDKIITLFLLLFTLQGMGSVLIYKDSCDYLYKNKKSCDNIYVIDTLDLINIKLPFYKIENLDSYSLSYKSDLKGENIFIYNGKYIYKIHVKNRIVTNFILQEKYTKNYYTNLIVSNEGISIIAYDYQYYDSLYKHSENKHHINELILETYDFDLEKIKTKILYLNLSKPFSKQDIFHILSFTEKENNYLFDRRYGFMMSFEKDTLTENKVVNLKQGSYKRLDYVTGEYYHIFPTIDSNDIYYNISLNNDTLNLKDNLFPKSYLKNPLSFTFFNDNIYTNDMKYIFRIDKRKWNLFFNAKIDNQAYITIRGFYLFDYEKKKIYFYNNIGSVPNKLIEEK